MVRSKGLYREQEFAHRCSACDGPAASACRRCGAPVCPDHTLPAWDCCVPCSEALFRASSVAGKVVAARGVKLTFVALFAGYVCLRVLTIGIVHWPVAEMIAAAAAVAGVATGFGVAGYGMWIAPRVAAHRLAGELRHPRQLAGAPAPAPQAGDDQDTS